MYWPLDTPGGLQNFCIFLMWNFLTLYNYFQAAFKGPGFVPPQWRPANPEHMKLLQYCDLCECYKTPRSHHCRKCDRCVMKMDHHCPWINTCCGHFNHAHFTWFLFFAPCGCIHSLFILIPSIYRALNFTWYLHYGDKNPLVYLGIGGFLVTMFSIGLAIGVIIAVWMLFAIQMKSIIKNETGIESWIIDKAEDRERDEEEGDFIYPYNLGCWENLKQVFTFTGKPKSDGFTWDVVKGCDQFTFTVEQLQQKALKRERTIEHIIVEDYSGALIPISKGCGMCCGIPCTDEPRIAVKKGDIVKVTRWKKKWLYGTKEQTKKNIGGKKRLRGWFPRRCAKEHISSLSNGDHSPDCPAASSKKEN